MTAKKPYMITITGCDDSTAVEIELTGREFALMRRIAELTDLASEYSCQPVMTVNGPVKPDGAQ